MSSGDELPSEIVLTWQEAGEILLALDAAEELPGGSAATYARIRRAAQGIIDKFLPDLRNL